MGNLQSPNPPMNEEEYLLQQKMETDQWILQEQREVHHNVILQDRLLLDDEIQEYKKKNNTEIVRGKTDLIRNIQEFGVRHNPYF